MIKTVDFLVIGSGPAGRRAAIQAAKLGHSVLVVERGRKLGGVSVHTGTIPSKTLRETVLNLTGWRERGFYGRTYRVKQEITAQDLHNRLRTTLNHEVEILEHQFCRNRVEFRTGTARFIGPNEAEITHPDEHPIEVQFKKALISVGTIPHRPDDIPFDGDKVLDSDDILELQEIPRSLTVIGAGVIGVEYASIFNALDVNVTLVEPRKTILPFIDIDIVTELVGELRDRGVDMRLGCKAAKITRLDNSVLTVLSDHRVIESDMVLYAAGRTGAVGSLGLENCGIETDCRGRIKVNPDTMQSSNESIYAAGDIIGFPSLASVSMEQGRIAACHAFGAPLPETRQAFPYGIYAVPEMSTIGATEDELRQSGVCFECGIARFRETSRGHIMGLDRGIMKMLFCLETKKLLGVHIVGEGATELIHIGQAVLNLGGTLNFFLENVFNYPTLAEAYKIAALDAWNKISARRKIIKAEEDMPAKQPEDQNDPISDPVAKIA